jgi:intracellular multiplication protein IcmT
MSFNSYNHWRNTARPVRFFNVDYRAGVFVFVFMMHMRMWTFLLLLIVVGILWYLERRGLTMPLAMRRVRVALIGAYRPALAKLHDRPIYDHGGI